MSIDVRTLSEVLQQVAAVPDYAGVEVTDANTLGLFSSTPLHVAAVWGDCEAISLLAANGARINQRGEHGFTALMEAVAQGHLEASNLLASLGAEPIRNDKGHLPSEYADLMGYEALSSELARKGL